ncbi:MAG TPA: helix-turn-helix domain-containing protein [Tepidisphaeraceae bacterium]|nr:helix-turn-helix domain-containing protein [Tepidisphaeraceae bacterium]
MKINSETISLMNVGRVARVCGVSVRTVKRWIKGRQIPAFKIGSAWMIDKSDLDSWLTSKRVDVKE